MSDLFHPEISEEFLTAVVQVMVATPWHTYQVLTKRAERLSETLRGSLAFAAGCSHIWWGVSVEDRKYGIPRIQHLRESNANVKFLSVEPLLEDLGDLDVSGIDWVIVGGESGRSARPISESWVTSIQRSCRRDKVHFFFKQWGGPNKKASGRELRGKTYDAMPRVVRATIPEKALRMKMSIDLTQRFTRDNVLIQIET